MYYMQLFDNLDKHCDFTKQIWSTSNEPCQSFPCGAKEAQKERLELQKWLGH